jgi:hypothetical protein
MSNGEYTGNFRGVQYSNERFARLVEVPPTKPVLALEKAEKHTQVNNCCHETNKSLALLKQKLLFKDEQMQAERT